MQEAHPPMRHDNLVWARQVPRTLSQSSLDEGSGSPMVEFLAPGSVQSGHENDTPPLTQVKAKGKPKRKEVSPMIQAAKYVKFRLTDSQGLLEATHHQTAYIRARNDVMGKTSSTSLRREYMVVTQLRTMQRSLDNHTVQPKTTKRADPMMQLVFQTDFLKLAERKRGRHSDIAFFLTIACLFLVIVELFVLRHTGPSMTTNILKLFVTVFSLSTVWSISQYYRANAIVEQITASHQLYSRRWRFVLEILVCLIHAPPFWEESWNLSLDVAINPLSSSSSDTRQVSTDIIGLFVLLRLYLVVRVLTRYNAIVKTPAARLIGILLNVRFEHGFTVKSLVEKYPFRLLSSILVSLIIGLSLALYLIEGGESGTVVTFSDSVWFIIVSITTTGYGDIVPTTYAGRVIALIASAGGIIVTSLMVTIAHKQMEFTWPESRAFTLLAQEKHDRANEDSACRVIVAFFRYVRCTRHGPGQGGAALNALDNTIRGRRIAMQEASLGGGRWETAITTAMEDIANRLGEIDERSRRLDAYVRAADSLSPDAVMSVSQSGRVGQSPALSTPGQGGGALASVLSRLDARLGSMEDRLRVIEARIIS